MAIRGTTQRESFVMPSPTDEEIQEAFDLFETNDNGCISIDDMHMAIRGLGQTPSNAQIQTHMADLGIESQCSFVDLKRLCGAVKDDVDPKILTDAFKLFDTTGRGSMPGKDLVGVLQAWQQKLSQAETEEFMRLAHITEASTVDVEKIVAQLSP
mmetsp:Transcript_28235/g.74063  ORF Transcript_28235/g.74063 Transcript_28235/m.74063 type:complete len:155 (-) Transcript_28235:724-1188(-)